MLKSVPVEIVSKEGITFCYYNSLIKGLTAQSVKPLPNNKIYKVSRIMTVLLL